MRIVVTGSLAYDYIMSFPGQFKEHLLQDKLHSLTVSFLVDSMKRLRGGVAGNVAYTLALLGERPLVVATAGHDFGEYHTWMTRHGIDASGVQQLADEFTASCFINTDLSNNQIVAFYSGAMARARDLSLEGRGLSKGDLVLISPTDPLAIARYASECKQLGLSYVFDPGKQTPRLTRDQILAGLEGAAVLIGNDYELGMMAQKTGWSEAELIAAAPLTVITRGEAGSTVYSKADKGAPVQVRAVPVREVVDPTGAGDAYLGGLAFGLARNLPLTVAAQVASVAAAFAIEHKGCQEHHYTRSQFLTRYGEVYGDASALTALEAA